MLSKKNIKGAIDGVQFDHLYGWAVNTNSVSSKLVIEVLEGETPLGSVTADQLHKGLASKGVGDGRFGFVIPLPPSLQDGKPHVLRVRVCETGEFLASQITYRSQPKAIGHIEGISAGVVFGWYSFPKAATGDLAVYLDGVALDIEVVQYLREDIVPHETDVKAIGYKFDLSTYLNDGIEHELTILESQTGSLIGGAPFRLVDRPAWGVVDFVEGHEIGGWVVLTNPVELSATVELWVDGRNVAQQQATQIRSDLRRLGVQRTRCGFRFTLPSLFMDGTAHTVQVRLQGSDYPLRNSSTKVCVEIAHAVCLVQEQRLVGWIVNKHAPQHPFRLDLWDDGSFVATFTANLPREDLGRQVGHATSTIYAGFDCSLPPPKPGWTTRRLKLALHGETEPITGMEIVLRPRATVIEEIETATRQYPALKWVSQGLLAQQRQEFSAGNILFREEPPAPSGQSEHIVDVIIPVYKGNKETLDCIRSVLEAPTTTPYELIVINDASPDPDLTAALRQMVSREPKPFTLIENAQNMGFVATVNRGICVHQQRDVILLNADTVVPKSDWLKRLQQAAIAQGDIATVTPFSNRATICSLPRTVFDNDLPQGYSVDSLDAVCKKVNSSVYIDIPTAVGFCMYIKRQAIREIGLFDAARWGKGYGEENDFCIRAAALGWRHVAACDVFVLHHGAISFQAEREARAKENLAILNQMYPDYPQKVSSFLANDPLAEPRAQVVLPLMQAAAPSYVLHVMHAWGGGIQIHVNEQCARLQKESQASLILRPSEHGWMELTNPHDRLSISYPARIPIETIAAHLRQINVKLIHFHQTIGLPDAVWQLPAKLAIPFEYTVHDYYLACPRINLLDETGRYCGQPDIEVCENCVSSAPLPKDVQIAFVSTGNSVASWRKTHTDYLANAQVILAPSQDAKNRFQRFFELKQITFQPHCEPSYEQNNSFPPFDGLMRIAILGALGLHKGHKTLIRVARLAQDQKLPLQFVIVGYTCDDQAYSSFNNVEILGPYEPDQLPQLVNSARCHVALFLSIWPETYSYTLSEALRAGLFPVVTGLGAQAERVAEIDAGIILDENPTPRDIVDSLMRLRREGYKKLDLKRRKRGIQDGAE